MLHWAQPRPSLRDLSPGLCLSEIFIHHITEIACPVPLRYFIFPCYFIVTKEITALQMLRVAQDLPTAFLLPAFLGSVPLHGSVLGEKGKPHKLRLCSLTICRQVRGIRGT